MTSEKQIDIQQLFLSALILGLLITIPSFAGIWTGIFHMFVPVTTFLIFSFFGRYAATRIVLPVFMLCSMILLAKGDVFSLLFSAVMICSGFILHHCWNRQESPLLSGSKMLLGLIAGWTFLFFLGTTGEHNLYGAMVTTLQTGVNQTIEEYQKSRALPPETIALLKESKQEILEIIPWIIPGIIGAMLVFLTWFSEVTGSRLLTLFGVDNHWPPFRSWQVSDKLIWVFIGAFFASVIPSSLVQALSINLIMILCLIYGLQGLSLLSSFLEKRDIGLPFQILIYGMIASQVVGLILLLVIGVASTWVDFRKNRQAKD